MKRRTISRLDLTVCDVFHIQEALYDSFWPFTTGQRGRQRGLTARADVWARPGDIHWCAKANLFRRLWRLTSAIALVGCRAGPCRTAAATFRNGNDCGQPAPLSPFRIGFPTSGTQAYTRPLCRMQRPRLRGSLLVADRSYRFLSGFGPRCGRSIFRRSQSLFPHGHHHCCSGLGLSGRL